MSANTCENSESSLRISVDKAKLAAFLAQPVKQAQNTTPAREKNQNKFKSLNNLNFRSPKETIPPPVAGSPVKNNENLNNLKADPVQSKGGIPRLELYTDPILKKAMAWGVEEWLVQICIRDYGDYVVKAQIQRLWNIPEGYFKPQYGPVDKQRGRLFNTEMQKLRAAAENKAGKS